MDRVKDILPRVLKKRGVYDEVVASAVVASAAAWIRTNLPAYADDLAVSHAAQGRLHVKARSTVALMALKALEQTLLDHIAMSVEQGSPTAVSVTRA